MRRPWTAICASEGLVLVQQRLDPVLAGRQLGEARDRIAEDGPVDHRFGSRGEGVDVGEESCGCEVVCRAGSIRRSLMRRMESPDHVRSELLLSRG